MRSITSTQHELVKHIIKLRQNRDYRADQQSVVIEGIKPVQEIVQHIKPKVLIAWNETLLPQGIEADQIVLVNEAVMKKISGMQTPEGILVEIPMPKPSSLTDANHIIALDGINDPGNVGTLLRTALALGWDGAFLLNESCDPFNEKALRAARGATFHLPLAWGSWETLKEIIKQSGMHPVGADLKGCAPQDLKHHQKICLVLGNEAQGLSEEAKKLCQLVTIDMAENTESLNVAVAGGILMYCLARKKL